MRTITFLICLIYTNAFVSAQDYWIEDNGDTIKIVAIDTLILENGEAAIEYEGEEVLMEPIIAEFSYKELYKSGYYDSLALYYCDSIELDINFNAKKRSDKLKGTNLQFMSFFSDSIDIIINNQHIASEKFIALGNCIVQLGEESFLIEDSLGFRNKENLTLYFRTQNQKIDLEIDLGFEIIQLYFYRADCKMIVNHDNYEDNPFILRKRALQSLNRK